MLIGLMTACSIQNATAEEDKLLLYQSAGDFGGGTNQWWISTSSLLRTPRWKLERNEPPLSLRTALTSAKKWIAKKGVGGGDVESIVLRPATSNDSSPFRHSFYYIIRFGIAPYGNHATCVVLMDGTIVEPQ
jgi:hypothetical protein